VLSNLPRAIVRVGISSVALADGIRYRKIPLQSCGECIGMLQRLNSITGPALIGVSAVAISAAWIYFLFFVIGPLSR
jgi:hypothetical protein